jgi:nuclear autoantigenic sperm protein
LLYKSQEETDPLGNVPKSAPDEESVKSTANKDNGNSKASSSNVKDAPSPDKGGLEEGMLLFPSPHGVLYSCAPEDRQLYSYVPLFMPAEGYK